MTPEELALEVEAFIEECRERVEGVGARQYYKPGEPQKFETMILDELFEYAEEELRDCVVYATMLRIRLRRLRDKMFYVTEPKQPEPTDAGPDHYAGIFDQFEPPRKRSSGGMDILPGIYHDQPKKE